MLSQELFDLSLTENQKPDQQLTYPLLIPGGIIRGGLSICQ